MFGDTAVQAVLLVSHNMQKQEPGAGKENPWLAKFNLSYPGGGRDDSDSDQDAELEESKVPL